MKQKLSIFTMAVAAMAAFALAAQAQLVGGYKTIAADDAGAGEAAEFAVSTKAEEQEGLSLSAVLKAERQVVQGTNYRLCIEVELDGESQYVGTVVYRSLQGEFTLKSWSPVESCGGSGGERATRSRKPAACTASQLKITQGDGEADMGGKRYAQYILTNVSTKKCTLRGYPTVAALNRSGKVIKAAIEYNESFPGGEGDEFKPSIVTLDAGGQAWFQIYYNDGMALDHPKITKVAKLRVTATSDKKPLTVNGNFGSCCGLTVSSIHSGVPQ